MRRIQMTSPEYSHTSGQVMPSRLLQPLNATALWPWQGEFQALQDFDEVMGKQQTMCMQTL